MTRPVEHGKITDQPSESGKQPGFRFCRRAAKV